MLQGWIVIGVALAYIGLLFVIASLGDRSQRARASGPRKIIYPLSLAIYCTSWTFFGSVGLASRTSFDFLTIYIGPVLVFGLGYPLVIRIMRLAKAHNITSIADFIAARYGKGQAVAATVALIAIVGTIPYIALQLKAVSSSLATILAQSGINRGEWPFFGDLSLVVALSMATFAVLFGTRHTDATEHQQGLMLAIAAESIVKLVAFLAVGVFVTFVMFDGPSALFAEAMMRPEGAALLTREPLLSNFATMTLLSSIAILLLPRQFHVAIVENQSDAEIRRAAWLFPLYLLLINLFVVPIALAGLLAFPEGRVDSDMFVLALPLAAGSEVMTLVAFVGGLSAATAMVIVESVALAIMVSNDIVMPLVLKRREALARGSADIGAPLLLRVRRLAIFSILILAYVYYRSAGEAQLASIGLLSFAAIAQFAPCFFIGLVWRRATARGAIAGMVAGTLAWAYTLLLPSVADAGIFSTDVVVNGPLGIAMLRPQALFGVDLPPLVHGVFWSLGLNLLAYVSFSLGRAPASIERVQASAFVPSDLAPAAPTFRLWRTAVTVGELTATVARYLGEERTRSSFESFAAMRRSSLDPAHEADIHLLRYAEHLLASAIGAASSRLVLSLLLRKRTVSREAALKLLDEANAAIHYNRELLQTALEHVSQGIAVFDTALRLVCWNRRFGEILDVPPERVHVGATLQELLAAMAERAGLDEAGREAFVRERLPHYGQSGAPYRERFAERGLVIEVRASRMPDGGVVTMFTDITASVEAAEALERRVRERTEELTRLNAALARAKAEADEANLSKTRFLAAASHDILQPLNAARLYVTSLLERQGDREERRLVANIDASLEAVEEILSALLDISRLDAGALKPERTEFVVGDLLRQLELEFMPLARAKGLELVFVPSAVAICSDRRLLRRLLQNLISNALKYTVRGRVLVGCRRRGESVEIGVYDTGVGIPSTARRAIFQEFHRLDEGARVARGLGLGLSIVERIARVLDHRVDFRSAVGRGSHFWVEVPRARAPAGEAARPAPRNLEAGRLAGMTVVCIDNEPAILDGMAALLKGWGCSVVLAPDLGSAARALEGAERAPTGLLVDYHLDEGNGLDAIAALRARYGAELPAILVTADRSPRVREEARARQIKVLSKPIKPAALRALLAQWRVRPVVAAE
ncbi:MAG: hybrid sensor histidine kinase/response regulator [Variibacter sp.]|nr:hybrid sensor histidine kinase/response regulator [Variibacter sp.]